MLYYSFFASNQIDRYELPGTWNDAILYLTDEVQKLPA
jgi:hypothetical protein